MTGCDLVGMWEDPKLVDTQWELEAVEAAAGERLQEPENWEYWFRLKADGTVEGQYACNSCSGSYTTTGPDSISIRLSCTEAGCTPPPSVNYFMAMASVRTYRLDGNRLQLFSTDRNSDERILIHQTN